MEITGIDDWFSSPEVGEFQRELEERITRYLFLQEGTDFERMIAQLAWIGAREEHRALLLKDIIHLRQDEIIAAGFCKSFWKGTKKTYHFVVDHSAEILAGVAVVAATAAIIASGGTASVVLGGVVVAGAGSIFGSDEPSYSFLPNNPPCLSASELKMINQPILTLPKLDLPASDNEVKITADGIWAGGEFFPNTTFINQSHFKKAFDPLPYTPAAKPVDTLPPFLPSVSPKNPDKISTKFIVMGHQPSPSCRIGWINGIANSYEESTDSAIYIQKLAQGQEVSGIYNHSHKAPVDVLEAAVLNHFLHLSPITSDLLKSEWEAFHELNKENPKAKFLQICHSQGTIHVRNTLESCPEEIRDRIIVIAIAPAAIVPKQLCFDSFNFASRRDPIHALEPDHLRSFPLIYDGEMWDANLYKPVGNRDQLRLLEPHPDAPWIDHPFQSLTYTDILEKIIKDYKKRKGEYFSWERGL